MAARKREALESIKNYRRNLKKEQRSAERKLRGYHLWTARFGQALRFDSNSGSGLENRSGSRSVLFLQ